MDSSPWLWAILITLIATPMSWVRNIANFSFTFLLGNILIAWAVIVCSYYAFATLISNADFGPNLELVNEEHYLITVGFAIYSFEGIGIVMPVM